MYRFDVLIFHLCVGWGGAENTTCNIARALSKGPFKVAVLTNEKRFLENLDKSISVQVVPFRWWFENWADISIDLLRLLKMLRRLRPRVVVGIMPYASFLVSLAKRFMSPSFVYMASPRGSCLNYLNHFVPSPVDKIRYRVFFLVAFALADYFLTPSRLSLEDYIKHFRVNPGKAIVIPNGVRIPSRFKLERALARREKLWETPNTLWVGRVSLEKRLDFILGSFALLSSRMQQVKLLLVGDGSYRDEGINLTRKLGLEDRVEWVGYRKNVMPFWLRGHVFLHACLWEEFGYSVAEAMGTGLPVVAYDCPYGPREILDGGRYGILVKTEEEMAEAIEELLKNIDFWRILSRRAFERAQDFELGEISEAYRKAFKMILP